MEEARKYKRLIESIGNEYFFYSHDINGKYSYMSPAVENILGYPVQEAINGLVQHLTDSELNKKTIETLQKSAIGEQQKTFELELFTKERKVKVIEITESPLFDKNGKLISIDGVAHEITRRKKNENLIKKQNKELQKQKEELVETIQNLKETQAQLVQSEKMGALGHLIAGIAHEINTPIGAINASVSNISASLDSSMQNLYTLFTKQSKTELIVFLRIIELIDNTKVSLTSKEKRLYKKQIRLKLEEAGYENSYALTESLIYLDLYREMDRILPLITKIDNPELVLKSIKYIYSIRKNSDNIKMAVDKASTIVFALKKFSHKDQGGSKEKANVADNIETVLVLLQNKLKQGIDVIKNYEEIPLINCYPDELVQVWTNLITNAIHAMENSGQLTIAIKNQGEKVKISITDNGMGIPDKIKEKIFEPFFTTKKAGEGTGIGLDLVAKIIKKHNAVLDLESKVGIGTTFTILLPIN